MLNNIEISLEPDYSETSNGKLYLKVILTIDGVNPLQSNGDDFDICELIQSATRDGVYFVWTCGCGVPGCAGYFNGIEVVINNEIITWSDKDQDKEYNFSKKVFKQKIEITRNEILKWNLHAESNKMELNIWPSWTMQYLLPIINERDDKAK